MCTYSLRVEALPSKKETLMDERTMTTREAILYLGAENAIPSKYQMAQFLSTADINVSPIQISNYLNGTRMSRMLARSVYDRFNIIISDSYGKDKDFTEECKRGIVNLKSQGLV